MALTYEQAHQVLGHQSIAAIHNMAAKGLIQGLNLIGEVPDKLQCTECVQGKLTRNAQPCTATNVEAKEVGAVIVSDVWGGGTKLPLGFGGTRYIVTFTDVYLRFVTIYPIKIGRAHV